MKQISFIDFVHQGRTLRSQKFLQEMDRVIPWKRLCNKIKPHYYSNDVGRRPMSLLLMLRIYFLQQWYQLSDPAMEDAIHDRYSFQSFLRLNVAKDAVPDETTILKFRHLLEEHHLVEKLFKTVNRYLEEQGLMMKKGTIVDATIIPAPKSTKNQERQRDPEMSSTRKNGQWHFGMKGHIGVDSDSGLVHTVRTTSARVSDRDCFHDLLHEQEQVIIGDKGYWSDRDKRFFRKHGVAWGVSEKRKPTKGPLSTKQHRHNRHYSRIRSKVEHVFQVIKCRFGYVKARYRGLQKNGSQLMSLCLLHNLYKVRKHPIFAVC